MTQLQLPHLLLCQTSLVVLQSDLQNMGGCATHSIQRWRSLCNHPSVQTIFLRTYTLRPTSSYISIRAKCSSLAADRRDCYAGKTMKWHIIWRCLSPSWTLVVSSRTIPVAASTRCAASSMAAACWPWASTLLCKSRFSLRIRWARQVCGKVSGKASQHSANISSHPI